MLNNIGLPGLLLIAVVVLVLFGRGKISSLMGEVGKGITSFKKGIADGSKDEETDPALHDTPRVHDTARVHDTPRDPAHVRDVTPVTEKDKV